MTNLRPLLPIVAVVVLGGAAHAGEFSLGSTHMLAQAGTDSSVDVTVNFTDRGRALRETAEGGDSTPAHTAHDLRGADQVVRARCGRSRRRARSAGSEGADVRDRRRPIRRTASRSRRPTAIRRPSYRWQSLVPGTIK